MDSESEDDNSDLSSILDPDTVGLEDEISCGSEESLFGSDSEDDDSNIFVSKCGTVNWTQRPPEPNSEAGPKEFGPHFNVDLKDIKTPVDAFRVFFDDSIVSSICRFTNAEGNSDCDFKDVTEDEMWAWVAILIAAGKNHDSKMNYKDMWSTDDVSSRLFYSAVMGRTRFELIYRYLRFDDSVSRRPPRLTKTQRRSRKSSPRQQHRSRSRQNTVSSSAVPATDRLQTVRQVIERVRQNILKSYSPSQDLTIDERMIPYRGRCCFRIYMKSKPCRYGIKMWSAVDPVNSMLCNFDIYAGKIDNKPEKQQGKRVVTQLLEPFYNTNRRVTFDNFFTSFILLIQLLALGFVAIGTLRANKKEIPAEFLPGKSKQPGTAIYGFHENKVMLVSWTEKKNKTVLLMSTDPSSMPNEAEIKVSAERKEKPKVVTMYNSLKGGVDTLDKSTGYYTCKRRTNRYPVAIIYNIIDICTHNAFHMYVAAHPEFRPDEKSKKNFFLDWLSKELALNHVQQRKLNSKITQDVAQKVDTFLKNYNRMYGMCYKCSSRENLEQCQLCNALCCPADRRTKTMYTCPSCAKKDQVSTSYLKSGNIRRCAVCPRSRDIKTTVICHSCGVAVCGRHENRQEKKHEICEQCLNK